MRRIMLKKNPLFFLETKALYIDQGDSESLSFKC